MYLTKAQKRALSKLGRQGQTAYRLQETLSTLRALEKRGLALSSGQDKLGALFDPSVTLLWHRVED